jgi:hypothetical protein
MKFVHSEAHISGQAIFNLFRLTYLIILNSKLITFINGEIMSNNGNRNRASVPGTGQKSGSSNKPGGRTKSSNRNPKFQHGHGMQDYKKNRGQ